MPCFGRLSLSYRLKLLLLLQDIGIQKRGQITHTITVGLDVTFSFLFDPQS